MTATNTVLDISVILKGQRAYPQLLSCGKKGCCIVLRKYKIEIIFVGSKTSRFISKKAWYDN